MISWIIKTKVCVICRSLQITQTRGFDNSWYHTKTEFNAISAADIAFIMSSSQAIVNWLNALDQSDFFIVSLIAFVERSHNAVLSRVLWEWRHGKLFRSCAPIWPLRSRGETNYIIANPICAVHFFGVQSLCFVKCGSLNCEHLPSKIFFFSLEILLGTDIIHQLYISIFVSKVIDFFPLGSIEVSHYKIRMNPHVENKNLLKKMTSKRYITFA